LIHVSVVLPACVIVGNVAICCSSSVIRCGVPLDEWGCRTSSNAPLGLTKTKVP
jgi:hypothetical protein